MRTRLLLAAVLLACSAPKPRPPRGEVVVSFVGKVENGPFRFGRDDLPDLPRRSFEAQPAPGAARARFEGLAVAGLLGETMEPKREVDTVVFHGEGGVAAPVPLALVRQLGPVLADRVNGAPVAEWRAAAAPLQLAWPNLDAPGFETDPRSRWWWVGGVREVSLQAWTTTYGRALRVPVGATDGARLGADAIGSQCITCHRVRGTGGRRGPELKVALVQGRPDYAATLRVHLRHVSGQPSAPDVPPATARQIADFLEAIALAGPHDEPVPPPDADRDLEQPRPADQPARR